VAESSSTRPAGTSTVVAAPAARAGSVERARFVLTSV
jgi:hypothetical protein